MGSPKQIRSKYANKKSQSKGVDKRNLHKFTKTDAFKKPATAYFLPPIFAVKSSRNCNFRYGQHWLLFGCFLALAYATMKKLYKRDDTKSIIPFSLYNFFFDY